MQVGEHLEAAGRGALWESRDAPPRVHPGLASLPSGSSELHPFIITGAALVN